jgi:hypothetical protein
MIVLGTLALCFVSFCVGVVYAGERNASRRHPATSWSVPTITSLPRAVARPAALRRNPKPDRKGP